MSYREYSITGYLHISTYKMTFVYKGSFSIQSYYKHRWKSRRQHYTEILYKTYAFLLETWWYSTHLKEEEQEEEEEYYSKYNDLEDRFVFARFVGKNRANSL